MTLELEQKRTGVRLELCIAIGHQHQIIEQLWHRGTGVWLPCMRPILLGEGGNRDGLPDLEAHLELVRDLVEVAPELIGRGRTAERRIIANCPEQRFALVLVLAVLPQASIGEFTLSVGFLVNLALPAFVGPCGGPESNQG